MPEQVAGEPGARRVKKRWLIAAAVVVGAVTLAVGLAVVVSGRSSSRGDDLAVLRRDPAQGLAMPGTHLIADVAHPSVTSDELFGSEDAAAIVRTFAVEDTTISARSAFDWFAPRLLAAGWTPTGPRCRTYPTRSRTSRSLGQQVRTAGCVALRSQGSQRR